MKRGWIAAAIAVALVSSPACFRASVDTDYNADATKLLSGHPKIPATAALAISQEQKDRKDHASKLGIRTDDYGFLTEAERKLRPVETEIEGIYIAGCAQGPKDIADAVAHANAAASKVQGLFARH